MKHVTDERRLRTDALRAALRARQRPRHCPKHPHRPSRKFSIHEPGRARKVRWLCVECAAVLVDWHGATLKGVHA